MIALTLPDSVFQRVMRRNGEKAFSASVSKLSLYLQIPDLGTKLWRTGQMSDRVQVNGLPYGGT